MSMYNKIGYPHTHGTLKKVTHFEGEYLSSGYPQNVKKLQIEHLTISEQFLFIGILISVTSW